MSASKDLYEAASKDEALKAELERASWEALGAFLRERGLERDAAGAVEAAARKVAEAHGLGLGPAAGTAAELDLDELDAVAGGTCNCPGAGVGSGTGKQCFCLVYGKGENDSGKRCVCRIGGVGGDD